MKRLWSIFGWNMVAASIAILFYLPFALRGEWDALAANSVAAIVYSNCIGTLVQSAFEWTPLGVMLSSRRFPFDWLLLVTSLFAFACVGCLVGSGLLVATGLFGRIGLWRLVGNSIAFSIVITMVVGVGGFFYEALRKRLHETALELRTRELEEERARKLAVEARLSSLESRIHPHFLFNTLNSISALIQEDPDRAERTVERLAALLRFSLDTSRRPTVPLATELKIVADYLEIEHARFGDRLRFDIDVPDALGRFDIPPLALHTLVENSVKHAIAPRREGGALRVVGREASGVLRLEVVDDGPGFADGPSNGTGLETLEGRLAALYGEAASLEIERRGDRTVVALVLPAAREGAAV